MMYVGGFTYRLQALFQSSLLELFTSVQEKAAYLDGTMALSNNITHWPDLIHTEVPDCSNNMEHMKCLKYFVLIKLVFVMGVL